MLFRYIILVLMYRILSVWLILRDACTNNSITIFELPGQSARLLSIFTCNYLKWNERRFSWASNCGMKVFEFGPAGSHSLVLGL